MIKYWVVPDNANPQKYAIIGKNKKPNNAICLAPEGSTTSDGKYITVFDVTENGIKVKKASLNDSQRDIDAQTVHQEKLAVQYQIYRKNAYPSIGDQLDAIYKKLALGDDTEWNEIASKIESVKAQFPKPE